MTNIYLMKMKIKMHLYHPFLVVGQKNDNVIFLQLMMWFMGH
jgi:hypothetical protein